MRYGNPRRNLIAKMVDDWAFDSFVRSIAYRYSEIGAGVRLLLPKEREIIKELTAQDMKNLRPHPTQFWRKPPPKFTNG